MQKESSAKVTRAERREQSLDGMLTAAIELFAARGYAGVTLDDVATVSGAKRSLILYYFKSKDELWRSAAEAVAMSFNALVRKKLAAVHGKDERQLQLQTLTANIESFLEQPNMARFLVHEGGVDGPRLDWLVKHFEFSTVPFGSDKLKRILNQTIMRASLMAIFLSMAALGPLMEASLAQVSGRNRLGVHPMSKSNQKALVAFIMRFLDAVDLEDRLDDALDIDVGLD